MDWTENQQCVLCDKGGNLLVCNDNGCPISVHKNCMGCEAHFDDAGNFHCPYCVYKQHIAEATRLRSKVTLTKKALSTFLARETSDVNHQEPVVEMADKDDGISSKDKSVDENHSVGVENRNESTEISSEDFNQNGGVDGGNNVNTCKMMVIYKSNSDPVSIRRTVDQQTENNGRKFKVVDQPKQSKSADIWLTIDDQITCKKRNKSMKFNMNGRKEEHVIEHGATKEFNQLSMSNSVKRCRVLWSEEEEEMLKEGVQKYSVLTNKNLPWKKILEFGRHVFNSSRTPSELKDKWRKIGK